MGLLNQTQQVYYQGNNHGDYQFTSLDDIVSQFMIAYVGEDKIIPRVKRLDVAFHAQRAMQELSFDTFKSTKAQEITVPASLQMTLPHDYVNYTKISWVDSAGIKHLLYPTSKTSNPTPILQNTDGSYTLTAVGTLVDGTSVVLLDSEYSNILVGMTVSGPNIPSGTMVIATANSGGITTIEIGNVNFVPYSVLLFTSPVDQTLTFTRALNQELLKEEESSHILENLSWTNTDTKITQSPNTDVSNIKVGMLVSHTHFPIGTVVVDVQGAVITTSNAATGTSDSANVFLNEITFVSKPKNSSTWDSYKSGTPSENQDDYQDDTYWPVDGSRFGLDPQHAQANGSFYIDNISGKIHFSSNISGKTVILDYISDSLGTDGEMQVHKFAEEAMYKWISHAVLASKANTPEYLVARYKKERFAAIRTAKLRLSNIKLEEITQILRGKSKQIKH